MDDKGVTFDRESFASVIVNGSLCLEKYDEEESGNESSYRRHFRERERMKCWREKDGCGSV